jgi:hypothetical protein
MKEELKEFAEFVDKITAAGLRFQQATKVDLKEPDEEDTQILFESFMAQPEEKVS